MATLLRTPTGDDQALAALRAAYRPGPASFAPEDSPFTTLFVDLTHRCNMVCRNCYIPVRGLPDLPADWLFAVLARLPRRTRIRLVGAEPTLRRDLPDIVARVRALGHLPVILSNGLRLARRDYVARLKAAGLRTVYLSLNGGLRDDLYAAIDDLACATPKLAALDNLLAARMHVTVGMILVPGLSERHLPEFLGFLLGRGVRDLHLRSVGPVGRHLEGKVFDLNDMEALLRASLPPSDSQLRLESEEGSSRDLRFEPMKIQLTAWPDLGSLTRGRLTPDARVEPMFESIIANDSSY